MLDRLRRLMPSHESIANNRWLRWLGPSLLHPRLFHLSRRGVATGAAIGVFFAFITPIAQIPLSAAACVALRANVPVAIVATLVNTPPTFGPVYYAAWKVGSWVLAEPENAAAPQVLSGSSSRPDSGLPWWQQAAQTLRDVGKPLLLGALLFAVGFSALAWLLCNGIWHWRVRNKRRRRLAAARRAAGA
ncbi:MAG: DUF2062 domain-containing protein [Rubrivivax sp.]|jgi:uncharacterized protein (DUF2062 family)|nr:DUF2062 domain-containing protein [Rubrivivax sp.]